jgi:serine/threonine-protein kinase
MSGVFTAPARPPEASAATLGAASSPRPWWRRAGPVAAAFAVGALAAAAVFVASDAPDTPAPVTRLALGTRGASALHVTGNDPELAITPDGSRVVYVGDGGRRIFVRALDELEPVAIANGSFLKGPFVSPDGQWVGYGEDLGLLKKVPIGGGPPVEIATGVGILRGAAWLADNTIVFASASRTTGLRRVSADGGRLQVLTTPDFARNEYDHYWPEALPDGRGVLYTILARTGGLSVAKTTVYDLETNTSKELLSGVTNAVYLRSGHLAYVAGGTLWTVPFDATRRSITGTAAPRMKLTATTLAGAGNFAVSSTGTLVYAHAPGYDPFARTLSWVDRATGKLEPLDAPEHPYMQPRISHDGTRVVHATGRVPENNLWVLDVGRRALTRLRNEASRDQIPSWSPDDRWIIYASDRAVDNDLLRVWRQAADGTGEPELLMDTPAGSATVTPDGTHLIFGGFTPSTQGDIMRMALDGSKEISPLLVTRFAENGNQVSPDGRWLAYQSNLSGRQEVYVGPYPNAAAARWPVSTSGGREPLWSRDGRELFYMAPDGVLMGVQVKGTGSSWAATSPVKVLEPGYWSTTQLIGRQFDISPDGKRFLVVTPSRATPDPPDLVVEQHWLEGLRGK